MKNSTKKVKPKPPYHIFPRRLKTPSEATQALIAIIITIILYIIITL